MASTGAILVRFAQAEGVDSLAIAAWRLLIAASVLWAFMLLRGRPPWQGLGAGTLGWMAAAGGLLAFHFAFWISSLALTSVAASVALVTSTPVWVGLATVLLLRERLAALTWVGILITLVGVGLMLGSGLAVDSEVPGAAAFPSSGRALAGNLLALGGAISFGAYLLIGRRLSGKVPLAAYVGIVYGAAAAWSVLIALLAGAPLSGYSTTGWLAVAGLALGPQLLGHTAFNWALGRLSPTFVALATLGEPVGSALLAALLFGEWPLGLQWLALGFILVGIAIAARGEAGGRQTGG